MFLKKTTPNGFPESPAALATPSRGKENSISSEFGWRNVHSIAYGERARRSQNWGLATDRGGFKAPSLL